MSAETVYNNIIFRCAEVSDFRWAQNTYSCTRRVLHDIELFDCFRSYISLNRRLALTETYVP